MTITEVYVLSGFLGSGKTTLLKNILTEEKKRGRQVAVLMNELGSISIDSDEVDQDIPLKELLDGCICCTISDKLEAQIQGLLFDYSLDAIYIETTGAAHPVEVIDAIMSPIFAEKMEMRGIITLVDSKRWLDRKNLSPQIQQLLLEQVRHADILLLNKADQISEREQGQITFEVQSLNPDALCLFTNFAKVNIHELKLTRQRRKKHETAHVQEQLQLQTFVYTFNNSIDQEEFEQFLRSLPDSVYRMKGYIRFDHFSSPYLFQYSYGMPMYMKEPMNMPLNLVIIGESLNLEEIQAELEKLENNGTHL